MHEGVRSVTTLVTRTVSIDPQRVPRHIGSGFDAWSLIPHDEDQRFLRFEDSPGSSIVAGPSIIINPDGYKLQTQAVLNATPMAVSPAKAITVEVPEERRFTDNQDHASNRRG